MKDGTEYLRARDIAELMGVSVRTVRRWIADEIIPSAKLGGARLVAKAELGHQLSPLPEITQEDTDEDNE